MELLIDISKQLVELVSTVHSAGVVIGDISFSNVIVQDDGSSVTLIDLESAARTGHEPLVKMITPGFSAIQPGEAGRSSTASFEDDCYALGSLLMTMAIPVQAINSLDSNGCGRFLDSLVKVCGLPESFAAVILALMQPQYANRITLDMARERLESVVPDKSTRNGQIEPVQQKQSAELERIATSILSMYTPERSDRLFHVSPISGHYLSVSAGAMGVVKFLGNSGHDATKEIVDDALLRIQYTDSIPAGLFNGLAGIAWVLLELGLGEEARTVYKRVMEHPNLYHSPDMYGGLAGVGMSCLKFWIETNDGAYLDDARIIGSWLLDNVHLSEKGARWGHEDFKWPIGYAHGSSGVSMFFLYLSLADSEPEYRSVGLKAIEYDLAHAVMNLNEGYLSFPTFAGEPILHPYWYTGSSGIGTALLRYRAVSPDSATSAFLEKVIPDVKRRYSVTPGLLTGLAGIANFLMDCRQFGLESITESAVAECVESIRLFEIETEAGPTGGYPGPFLVRLAADYAYGSAGIGSVLHRSKKCNTKNFNFLLDELLD